MRKLIVIFFASLLALIVLFTYQTATFSDRALHMYFCDVGQGDGIFIRTPSGLDIVIDGGPKNSMMLKCLASHMPFWDREIELVFATHPDADHIGGLIDVLKNYKVDGFYTSGGTTNTHIFASLKKEIAAKKIPLREISAGDKFTLPDGVFLLTFWPNAGFHASPQDTNSYSLVQTVSFGSFHALLTGDIPFEILDTINFPSHFDVFKLAHHGSKTGTDDLTLERIKAALAIISDGRNNRYHHPHPSVLALLKKYGISYKRTDEGGTIEIITDGKNTKVVN